MLSISLPTQCLRDIFNEHSNIYVYHVELNCLPQVMGTLISENCDLSAIKQIYAQEYIRRIISYSHIRVYTKRSLIFSLSIVK